MSYTQLKSDVTDWMHRDDLDSQMDTFTLLTESALNKELRVMEQEVILDMSFTDAYTDLPSDYLETRDLYVDFSGARCTLEQITPKQLNTRYSRAQGRVRAYAIHGGQIELRPSPNATEPTTGKWSYYARIPSLPVGAGPGPGPGGPYTTNDILDNYPLLYLSGMLFQANSYVQDAEEQAKWGAIFNEQLRTANKSAGDGRYSRPSVRIV